MFQRSSDARHSRLPLLVSAAFGIALAIVLFVPHFARAAGAGLRMSPSIGTFEVGGLIDVSFLVDTGGESVNVVEANVTFPADKLQVVNPAAGPSFVALWVQAPSYSNTDGTLKFQGGLPSPGIKTSAGVISTVTFRVKSVGKASIRYLASSKVLKNDGEGTNILASTVGADYTLKLPPPAGPVVTSPTHPETNIWYNNPQVQLVWEPVQDAVGYSLSFDQAAKQIPDDTIDTTGTTASVRATSDGVWYFHVKAKSENWGGVTSFPVQIDTTPPAGFTPNVDKTVFTVKEVGTLTFLTTDAASGIDHYEVKQVLTSGGVQGENTLFTESSSPYLLQSLASGEYQYIVRAIDRAGNTTDGSVKLTVVAAGLPFYARTPLLRNPAVANGALIGLLVLAALAIGLIIVRRVRIRSTFHHDLMTMEHDAQKRYRELQREMEELQEAQGLASGAQFQNSGQQKPPMPPQQ